MWNLMQARKFTDYQTFCCVLARKIPSLIKSFFCASQAIELSFFLMHFSPYSSLHSSFPFRSSVISLWQIVYLHWFSFTYAQFSKETNSQLLHRWVIVITLNGLAKQRQVQSDAPSMKLVLWKRKPLSLIIF